MAQVAFAVVWFGLGIVQLMVTWTGLIEWFGIWDFLAFVISLFIAFTPILGSIVGVIAAHDVLGWSWLAAIALFVGPPIAAVAFGMVEGAMLSRRNDATD